ncbi:hypothetical protein Mgra_00010097 [Meloidogyne graminicola]|uniref:Uncharacterized protein n=1 Tax=Meloidogyne graminicola TaxID=189291 RepID=A0A8S9Z645_9BILA|nr:hypothetical protein Mgra_00010097 [Meloidogyne graminicola]
MFKMKRTLCWSTTRFITKLFSTQNGPVIGINFGTTHSSVAILEDRKAKLLRNSEGSQTTPSVVAFNKDGECLVGSSAVRQAVLNSQNTIYGIKRLIGQKYNDENVQKIIKDLPFKIVNSSNGDVLVMAQDTLYTPSQITSFILTNLKETAENYLNKKISNAVITVPSHFNELQLQELKEASKLAGLSVLRMFNEASATAFSYYLDRTRSNTFAVLNFGGGFFDFSILKQSKNDKLEVISHNIDNFIGVIDFDNALVNYFVDEFQRENGTDLTKDFVAMQRLSEAAEKAKCELSSCIQTEIMLPNIAINGAKHFNIKLTRSKFEQLTNNLFERIIEGCNKVINNANLLVSDIDEILLIGGISKMPKVRDVIGTVFGKDFYDIKNNDMVVAVKDETIFFRNERTAITNEMPLIGTMYLGVLFGKINYIDGNRVVTKNYITKAAQQLFTAEREWDIDLLYNSAINTIKGFYLNLNVDILFIKKKRWSS